MLGLATHLSHLDTSQVCSLEVTCEILASCAATYANNGVSPTTGQRVMSDETVKNTLQIMYSCGMYDYSGEWACTIGLPGKIASWLLISDVLLLTAYFNSQKRGQRGNLPCHSRCAWSLHLVPASRQTRQQPCRCSFLPTFC
jgi:hypothetical protein